MQGKSCKEKMVLSLPRETPIATSKRICPYMAEHSTINQLTADLHLWIFITIIYNIVIYNIVIYNIVIYNIVIYNIVIYNIVIYII